MKGSPKNPYQPIRGPYTRTAVNGKVFGPYYFGPTNEPSSFSIEPEATEAISDPLVPPDPAPPPVD